MHLSLVSVAAPAQPGGQACTGVDHGAQADQRHADGVGIQDLRGHASTQQQHAEDLQQFQHHGAMVGVQAGQVNRTLQLMADVGILREALRNAVWMLEQARMHLAVRECADMADNPRGRAFVASLQTRVAELRATLLTHGVAA